MAGPRRPAGGAPRGGGRRSRRVLAGPQPVPSQGTPDQPEGEHTDRYDWEDPTATRSTARVLGDIALRRLHLGHRGQRLKPVALRLRLRRCRHLRLGGRDPRRPAGVAPPQPQMATPTQPQPQGYRLQPLPAVTEMEAPQSDVSQYPSSAPRRGWVLPVVAVSVLALGLVGGALGGHWLWPGKDAAAPPASPSGGPPRGPAGACHHGLQGFCMVGRPDDRLQGASSHHVLRTVSRLAEREG